MPAVARHPDRRVGRAGEVEWGLHRDHHLVVVPVVATLDLDDAIAAGGPLGEGGMASIVASVPELVKRHIGNPKRAASSSATSASSSHGVT